jgi:multidrug efflux pump subunit AcrB
MTHLSLKNPIAILMICLALPVFAAVVVVRLPIDTFPELTPPVLVVGTQIPGLGPREVEKTFSWRIEKYVSATPGVDHVESISRNGLSLVYVWLKWGQNLDAAQTLVQQNVAFAMAAVPKSLGVVPPFVLQYDPSNAPVVQVAVTAKGVSGPRLYDYAFNSIEPLLEGIPGVASAAVDGGRLRQINVRVDPVRAQARGLTTHDVANAVARSNALLPSGQLIAPGFNANVYTNGVPDRVAAIGEAPVTGKGTRAVSINDVARVEDSGSPNTQVVEVDGQNAVYLNVLRIPGGNTLAIVDAVKTAVASLRDLPPGVQVRPVFDQSTFVRTSYTGLKTEIARALVLIALVILLFLQSLRGTIIVSLAIPLSFAVTLIVLYASGQTLNAFTLGGLTLAMGRLVDDAVVVLESIHRHQREGRSRMEAALHGTNAVALPVLASTLTTMAVLLPIVLLTGLAKRLFAPLALTVAVAMAASYFVSIAVTPVACRYFLTHGEPNPVGRAVSNLVDQITIGYATALRATLAYRAWVLAACGLLVALAIFWAGGLPTSFFPDIDESIAGAYVRFAPGTSIEAAAREMEEIGRAAADALPPGTIALALSNVGTPSNARSLITSPNAGPHMGFIRLQLADPRNRRLSQGEITTRLRKVWAEKFPGVGFLQWPGGLVASVFENGYPGPLAVEVRGDNLGELDRQSQAIAEVARTVPGLRDITPTLEMRYPEIHVETDRQGAGTVDVTAEAATQATLEATLGNIDTPSVWLDPRNGQSYYVVTSGDPGAVTDVASLGQVAVRVGKGAAAVELDSFGHIRRAVGPISIERNRLQRAAHVLMEPEGRDLGGAAAELEARLRQDERTKAIPFSFVGQVELMRGTFAGLGLAIALAVMLVFMIMAAQFKSLRLPFVMLFTIPLSLVGIVLALMSAGLGFSITALMGVLMVIGIAVSNGILLVDAASRNVQGGMEVVDAVVHAARTRFVPIAMTSLATIVGLVPTALAFERGTESNQPLALAVVGGLTSSTLLSLFVVPAMFTLLVGRQTGGIGEVPAGGRLDIPRHER